MEHAVAGSVRAIVDSDALAHVVTINADGSPHATLAWLGLDDDEIVIGTLFDQKKLQNLRRDPRIAISLEAGAAQRERARRVRRARRHAPVSPMAAQPNCCKSSPAPTSGPG